MNTAIDPDELKRYSFNVWGFKQGEMVSLMIHIGDRLGLYQALAGAGPVTGGGIGREDRAQGALAARMAARAKQRLGCWTTGTATALSSAPWGRRCWRTRRAAWPLPPAHSAARFRRKQPTSWWMPFAPASACPTRSWGRTLPIAPSACSAPGCARPWCRKFCRPWTGWRKSSRRAPWWPTSAAGVASPSPPWPRRFPIRSSTATTRAITPSSAAARRWLRRGSRT